MFYSYLQTPVVAWRVNFEKRKKIDYIKYTPYWDTNGRNSAEETLLFVIYTRRKKKIEIKIPTRWKKYESYVRDEMKINKILIMNRFFSPIPTLTKRYEINAAQKKYPTLNVFTGK